MRQEGSGLDAFRFDARERARRKEALDVLLEARDRVLAEMTEEILAHQDVFLDASQGGVFSFEFQEIEDRFSVRLNSLNALLEHLEYRQALIRHRVETQETTRGALQKTLQSLLDRFENWDLADFEVVPGAGEKVLLVAVLLCDEVPD